MQQVDSIRLQGRASLVSCTLTFLDLVLGVALSDLLSAHARVFVLCNFKVTIKRENGTVS